MQLKSLTGLAFAILLLATALSTRAAELDYAIKLKTGLLFPEAKQRSLVTAASLENRHILVQFSGPITQSAKDQLAEAGIEVQNYIPNFAFTALCRRLPSPAELDQIGVRWLGEINPDQKISPDLTEIGFRDHSRHPGDRVGLVIVFYEDIDTQELAELLIRDYEAEIIGHNPMINAIDLIMPEKNYEALALLDQVMWIEQALPEQVELNYNSRNHTGAAIVHESPINITGAGVVVAEWDGGQADKNHWDFRGRITTLDFASVSTHATHVAGTILGSGESKADYRYKGMAPGAELLTQLWWSSSSNAVTEYTQVINSYNARVATNSWGFGIGSITYANCDASLGNYVSSNATMDNLVRGMAGAPISIVWSAGNERGSSSDYCGSIGWAYNTIGTLANAKNIVTVGAVSAFTDNMTSFSSWGPADDGRIKPDVCGPGASVTSCRPASGYTTMSGTSMSAPAVAGVLALIIEQWDVSFGTGELYPSTVKGILINTAVDMGREGPDYEYGHGKVDAVAAVTKVSQGDPSYVQGEISTGETQIHDLTVPGNAERLKVTLVWDDPGGTVSAAEHLINNLDLVLIDPFGAEHHPWTLNGTYPGWLATRSVDTKNNVETSEVVDPVPGLWKAKVSGFNIPVGPQKYSLIFTPDSINTPGNLTAVAVLDNGDLSADPGQIQTIEFWVTNVGAADDSIVVHLEDSQGWLAAPLDTTVFLAPYDSALISGLATVPGEALAGDNTILTCSGYSLSDTLAQASGQLVLSATQIFALALATDLTEDTVNSPATFTFDLTLTNLGNAGDLVTLTPTGEADFSFNPPVQELEIEHNGDTVFSFEIFIPAELAHLSQNQISVTATSVGGAEETISFVLIGNNPYFPPQLLSPSPKHYTQDGTPLFEWDSDGDSYSLLIATDTAMSVVVSEYPGLIGLSYELDPADSLADGVYYWAVRKFVGADSSSLQRFPFAISIDNGIPRGLQISSPRDNSFQSDSLVSFSFSLAAGTPPPTIAPEYNLLQYSQSSDFSSGMIEISNLAQYNYSPASPLDLGRWYWRIQRLDSAGNATPYASATFVLDTETPAIPALLTPADMIAIDDDTLEFTWTIGDQPSYEIAPHYYYMHISADGSFGDYNTYSNFIHTDTVTISAANFDLFHTYWWRVKAYDSAGFYSAYSPIYQFTYGVGLCGDLDSDSRVNLVDITQLIAMVYMGGEPPSSLMLANVNCDTRINLADITILIDHVYLTKSPMCCSPPD